MSRIALIIGATGGIGSETAKALLAHGWRVRAIARDPEKAARECDWIGPVEWVRGDAMNRADVVGAAEGVSVVVHAANPPGYRNWRGLALPMLESSIAAAKAAGARIVLPGTVYNFAKGESVLTETTSQNPTTRKGKIRVEMELRLAEAASAGTPVLIVRAGDFFGAHGKNNWFGQGLVKPGAPVTSVTYPGKRDVGHAWAYLPDLGETIARLLDRERQLARFDVFHFRGHWFDRGVAIAEATRDAAGAPSAPIRWFPWFAIFFLAPFVETFREMLEMRYLWRVPVRLDNTKLVAFLGEEPHTPLATALRTTLDGLGCARVATGAVAPSVA
jgi:nucleoside-diphosphate-sugar epimerase